MELTMLLMPCAPHPELLPVKNLNQNITVAFAWPEKENAVHVSLCQRRNFPQSCSCFHGHNSLNSLWLIYLNGKQPLLSDKVLAKTEMLECICRDICHCIIELGFPPHQVSRLQAFQEMQWMSFLALPLLIVCEGSIDMRTRLVSPSIFKFTDSKNVADNGQILK